ncbi:hypothetical protein [Actimicrobium antarcticum]|uniref:RpiR family transcriptional regulator n=1 Tax=Actimicrobium antarcticum TaxID=1051899 RepID=A0ABP7SX88_9BURK
MLPSFPSRSRIDNANALVSELFTAHGWDVDRSAKDKKKRYDLLVRKKGQCLVVEIKSLAEGRADRVIPMLSQAILQAQSHALDADNAQPLAVIVVEHASQSLAKQLGDFIEQYAPNVAVGLVSASGLKYFKGAGLEELNAEPEKPRRFENAPMNQPANLFSDLNQWMLKVLLAPDIPDHLLRAPRQKMQSGSELAEAAKVSPMSASRFLQQLRHEGYLEDSSRYLVVVRRQELFRRWQSAVMRSSPELPMRFLIRGPLQKQISSLLANNRGESCLALFGAADALGMGYVNGVPPYVYVPKLPRPDDKKWRALAATSPLEIPDLIVRRALSPQSVFRGAVRQNDVIVSDVIQVWLDVANHPSRGEEQANLIYEKVLRPIENNGN